MTEKVEPNTTKNNGRTDCLAGIGTHLEEIKPITRITGNFTKRIKTNSADVLDERVNAKIQKFMNAKLTIEKMREIKKVFFI